MKTIYLLRHAKASAGDASMSDENRPLNPQGRTACEIIGKYMKEQKLVPDTVLCSDAKRTRETWALVSEAGGIKAPVEYSKKLYLASAGEILRHIQALDEKHHAVLLVGHNPGIHESVMKFCMKASAKAAEIVEIKYPTGALAIIESDAPSWKSIAPEYGYLKAFITPKLLGAAFDE